MKFKWNGTALNLVEDSSLLGPFIHDGWVYTDTMTPKPGLTPHYSWLNTRTDIASDWNILHVGASILLTLWAWQVKSCIENCNLLQAYFGHYFFVNYSRILITSFVNLEAPYWGREGIMAYKRTSHSSNIKTWLHIILLPMFHFKRLGLDYTNYSNQWGRVNSVCGKLL